MSRLFGTDGIRGIVGEDLTAELAFLCGNALTAIINRPKVLVCTDTRISKDMLKSSIAGGLTLGGAEVLDLGIIPTPAAAFAAIEYGVDFGIVISASHNPPEYNGIKVFDGNGSKISDEIKDRIENFIFNRKIHRADLGTVKDKHREVNLRYIDFLVNSAECRLDGFKIVLDCSNGATFNVAPEVFKRLGAEVIAYFNKDDGAAINRDCGALHPQVVARLTVVNGADIGFAYDGDGDRLIAADNQGNIINGDAIVYIMANYLKSAGKLPSDLAIGTLHTNMAMENALKSKGITLLRTDIGDHFVSAKMKETGARVGGEQSGHIINGEYLPTGDGVLASVQLLKVMKATQKTLNQLKDFTDYPQVNINVKVKDKETVLNNPALWDAVKKYESDLSGLGRILVRPSGTEPLIRIMVECSDKIKAQTIGDALKALISLE